MRMSTRGQTVWLDYQPFTRSEAVELAQILQERATNALEYAYLVSVPEFGLGPLDAESAFELAGQLFLAACGLGAACAAAARLSGRTTRFVIA